MFDTSINIHHQILHISSCKWWCFFFVLVYDRKVLVFSILNNIVHLNHDVLINLIPPNIYVLLLQHVLHHMLNMYMNFILHQNHYVWVDQYHITSYYHMASHGMTSCHMTSHYITYEMTWDDMESHMWRDDIQMT